MNLSFAKYLILFLLFASCFENGRNIKKYGYLKNEEVSLNVPLKLSEFKEFGVFIDRLNEIVCNDSVPKIVIQNKNIYPVEDCNPKPFNPKGKHYITFHNGKPYKYRSKKEINMDSLAHILKNKFAYYHSSK